MEKIMIRKWLHLPLCTFLLSLSLLKICIFSFALFLPFPSGCLLPSFIYVVFNKVFGDILLARVLQWSRTNWGCICMDCVCVYMYVHVCMHVFEILRNWLMPLWRLATPKFAVEAKGRSPRKSRCTLRLKVICGQNSLGKPLFGSAEAFNGLVEPYPNYKD